MAAKEASGGPAALVVLAAALLVKYRAVVLSSLLSLSLGAARNEEEAGEALRRHDELVPSVENTLSTSAAAALGSGSGSVEDSDDASCAAETRNNGESQRFFSLGASNRSLKSSKT
jgi:hypothetical protein